MSTIRRILMCLAACSLCCGFARAQNTPRALLRVNADTAAPDSQRYYIDIFTDTALNQAIFDAFQGANPPVIGVLASKGIPVPGTGLIIPADNADRTWFRLYLDKSLRPLENFADKQFTIVLTNFLDDAPKNPKNQIRGIGVQRAFVRETATEWPLCEPQQLSVRFEYDLKNLDTFNRAQELYRALDTLRSSPLELDKIRIELEPLTRKLTSTTRVKSLRLFPVNENALVNNEKISACLETVDDLPTEKFDAKISWNTPVPPELVDPVVVLGLEGRTPEASPTVFVTKEKAVGVRAIEKDLDIGVSLVSAVEDVEQPDKSLLRKRTTRDTLDLRLGLFRNVSQLTVKGVTQIRDFVTQNICGRVSGYTKPSAGVMGTIIINDVPIGIVPGVDIESVSKVQNGKMQCLTFVYPAIPDAAHNLAVGDRNPFPKYAAIDPVVTPFIGPLVGPRATAGTYSILTPFYIDAKVSNGKIDKDTTSLNRIVFGIQEELRYYQNNFRFPTYYRFVFQGNHASDRDFKQKEYKATFEFRPVFGALNHPYDPLNTSSEKRTLCPTCKQKFKLIPNSRGFEFVPVIGAEIGRTYSRRNPAAAIEPSETVRRLYLGLDLVLNPTDRLQLKSSEQFYIRGESKTDRYHNYFLGELSYRLAAFNHGRAAHSIFFSWEKGGQPPFEDPDVNVLKLGYRVAATTLFSR